MFFACHSFYKNIQLINQIEIDAILTDAVFVLNTKYNLQWNIALPYMPPKIRITLIDNAMWYSVSDPLDIQRRASVGPMKIDSKS